MKKILALGVLFSVGTVFSVGYAAVPEGSATGTQAVAIGDNSVASGMFSVAAGTEATDAVNVSQLRLTEANFSAGLSETNRRIDSVKTDSDRGDALGAALAALNPIAYDPYEPTQIMAGLGNYKGHSAMAIGVAHYTNERTILHMGASSNGNDFMVNAGVTWKFGGAKKALPQQYQKGPISSVYTMQEEMTSIKSENQKLRQELELIKTQLGIQNNV